MTDVLSSAGGGSSSLADMMAAIEAQLKEEIELMDAQISASRAARGVGDNDDVSSSAAAAAASLSEEDEAAQAMVRDFIDLINKAADAYNAQEAMQTESFTNAQAQASEAIAALRENEAQLPSRANAAGTAVVAEEEPAAAPAAPVAAAAAASSSSSAHPTVAAAAVAEEEAPPSSPPTVPMTKGGMLLNYGKDRFMRSFQNHYVVVSDGVGGGHAGVAWYDSEAAYKKGSGPIDSIPFFIVEKNSRGSLFKKASVCWPLVTDEDCPKLSSADKSRTYFAVDYYNPKLSKMDLVVLGASSEAERDEWVTFITKFLVLYLPPGEEFEPFINFPVGANPPMHVSQVLGGEAPGSAQRVIDPTRR